MKEIYYLGELIKILWKVDKKFLFTIMLETIIFSMIPFLQLFLTEKSISMLTEGTGYKSYLVIICSILFGVLVINIANSKLNVNNNIKGNLIGQKMYAKIFEKCLYMDYEKLQRKNIQDKKELATMAFAGGSLAQLITYFKSVIGNIIIIVGVVGVVFLVDWKLMLLVLLIVAINGRQILRAKRIQYDADKEMNPINRQIDYFINMSSDFAVAKEVRLYHIADKLLEQYNHLYSETFRILKKVFAVNENNQKVAAIVNSLLEYMIYVLLGYRVIVSKDMSIAEFSTYALAIRTFSSSMVQIMEVCGEIEKNSMHLKDYFEFINIDSEFNKSKKNVNVDDGYEIRFENVGFKYPDCEEYALKNINLTISNGEKLSIVGENGSGKTTLVKLLTRLYDPTEGNIYLNGINIKEIDYNQYLNVFSTVFQDFKIYAFSIKDNITMFNYKDEEKIDNILTQIGMKEKVNGQKHGLDTFMYRVYDEEGIEFSGGQNQKLAIARALYKNSPIVIMDEPTAALDPRAENEIFEDFNNMVEGKTAIYISHRLSSCVFSDHIAVLKNGNMVEYGKHKELMSLKGLYSELFNMQAQYYIKEMS